MKLFLVFILLQIASPQELVHSPENPIVLTAGREQISKSRFMQIIETLSPEAQEQAKTQDGRRALAVQLGQLFALAEEARLEGLDKREEIKERIEIETDQVLASALIKLVSKPNEVASRAYFDKHQRDFEEIHLKQILVSFRGSPILPLTINHDRTEEEARHRAYELHARIVAGEAFENIAESESDDCASKAKQGDVGIFTRGSMVNEVEEIAFSLPLNRVSEPVRSPFGYHLLLVTAHRIKSFEEVRPEIELLLGPSLINKEVDEVKRKQGVTLDRSYFGN
jgi:parvulin-like peptidyl-prolyl isomerase